MNGRKARALRKQAALTAKTMDTDYQTHSIGRNNPRLAYKDPRVLNTGCHRAVYQQLKKGV